MLSYEKRKEYIFAVGALVIFSLLSMFPVTLIPVICSSLSAAVLGYITTKYHYILVAFAGLCIAAVDFLFTGNFLYVLLNALPVILCGLTLGIAYNVKLPPLKTVAIFTGVYTVNTIANLKISEAISSQNFIESVVTGVEKTYQDALSSSQLPYEDLHDIVSQITSMLVQFSPALIVIISFSYALLSFYLMKRICVLRKADCQSLTAFPQWRAEKSIGIIYFIMIALMLLVPSGSLISDAILNTVTVMTYVFFILGLAFLEHTLLKRFPKPGSRKAVLVVIAISSTFLAGVPFFIISIIGAMDTFMDYRRKKLF